MYTFDISKITLSVAFIGTLFFSYVLYLLNATRFKLLIVLLISVFLIYQSFWMTFTLGVMFVSLSAYNGTIRAALKEINIRDTQEWLQKHVREKW